MYRAEIIKDARGYRMELYEIDTSIRVLTGPVQVTPRGAAIAARQALMKMLDAVCGVVPE